MESKKYQNNQERECRPHVHELLSIILNGNRFVRQKEWDCSEMLGNQWFSEMVQLNKRYCFPFMSQVMRQVYPFALFRIFYFLKRKITRNFALKFSYCQGLICVQKLFKSFKIVINNKFSKTWMNYATFITYQLLPFWWDQQLKFWLFKLLIPLS